MTSTRLDRLRVTVCAVLLSVLSACAAQKPEDPRPLAECPVCRVNADLACLNVRVDGATPHAEYQGKTYYFCSEECRVLFERTPAKYAGR